MKKRKCVSISLTVIVLFIQISGGYLMFDFFRKESGYSGKGFYWLFWAVWGIGLLAASGGPALIQFIQARKRERKEEKEREAVCSYRHTLEQACRQANRYGLFLLMGAAMWLMWEHVLLSYAPLAAELPFPSIEIIDFMAMYIALMLCLLFAIWVWPFSGLKCPHCGSPLMTCLFREHSDEGSSRAVCYHCGGGVQVDFLVTSPFRFIMFGAGRLLVRPAVKLVEWCCVSVPEKNEEGTLQEQSRIAVCRVIKKQQAAAGWCSVGGIIFMIALYLGLKILKFDNKWVDALIFVLFLSGLCFLIWWLFRRKLKGVHCPACSSPVRFSDFSRVDEFGVAHLVCPLCGEESVSDFMRLWNDNLFPYKGSVFSEKKEERS